MAASKKPRKKYRPRPIQTWLPGNVQIEGQPASWLSRSNVGLGCDADGEKQ